MLDPKSLLPEVKKLVPGYSDQELMAGIQEFAKMHPDLSNQEALQALTMALAQQKPNVNQAAPAPQGKPFEGLVNSLGAN